MEMKLDNLILSVKHVNYMQFDEFKKKLGTRLISAEFDDKTPLTTYQKNTMRDYHFNIQVGLGDGAAYIGYQHNSEKPSGHGYSLKLEVNPSKPNKQQMALSEIFREHFKEHKIYIRGGELALDIPKDISSIIPISLTGRAQDRHKGTLYFGCRGKHGYLKIYDKKRELSDQQKIKVDSDFLTRVEYSFRVKDGLTLSFFKGLNLEIKDSYQISLLDPNNLDEVDSLTKAVLFSYQNGYQDLKEFTYTYKKKIKKALENMESIDLDHAFESAKPNIINTLKTFIA